MSKASKPGSGASNRRRRELAAAKYERQSARRTERAARKRRNQRIGAVAAVLVVAGVIGAFALWPDDADTTASPSPSQTPTASPSPSPSDIGCDPAPQPGNANQYKAVPKKTIKSDTDYTLALKTNCGKVTITTKPEAAPTTVNAMLVLATDGYFDDTPCHRLTTSGIWVLQCGDPTGTGTGSPGFSLPDENLPGGKGESAAATVIYKKGTVAMANAGANTGGSQFFIVYKDSPLPPAYTVWGTVTKGMDVVEKVANAGVLDGSTDGAPAASVGIVSTVVTPALG